MFVSDPLFPKDRRIHYSNHLVLVNKNTHLTIGNIFAIAEILPIAEKANVD